jgi:hypothetical protein
MKYLEKFRAILDFWHPEETIIFFLCFLENDPAFSKALKPDGREVYLCYILSFISHVASPTKEYGSGWSCSQLSFAWNLLHLPGVLIQADAENNFIINVFHSLMR